MSDQTSSKQFIDRISGAQTKFMTVAASSIFISYFELEEKNSFFGTKFKMTNEPLVEVAFFGAATFFGINYLLRLLDERRAASVLDEELKAHQIKISNTLDELKTLNKDFEAEFGRLSVLEAQFDRPRGGRYPALTVFEAIKSIIDTGLNSQKKAEHYLDVKPELLAQYLEDAAMPLQQAKVRRLFEGGSTVRSLHPEDQEVVINSIKSIDEIGKKYASFLDTWDDVIQTRWAGMLDRISKLIDDIQGQNLEIETIKVQVVSSKQTFGIAKFRHVLFDIISPISVYLITLTAFIWSISCL